MSEKRDPDPWPATHPCGGSRLGTCLGLAACARAGTVDEGGVRALHLQVRPCAFQLEPGSFPVAFGKRPAEMIFMTSSWNLAGVTSFSQAENNAPLSAGKQMVTDRLFLHSSSDWLGLNVSSERGKQFEELAVCERS